MTAVKLAFASDIHLDYVAGWDRRKRFYDSIPKDVQALLIAGDISNCRKLWEHLQELEKHTSCPTLFVLGNHDCWNGFVADAQSCAKATAEGSARLHYLTGAAEPYRLNSDTVVVGDDGWYDMQFATDETYGFPDWAHIWDFPKTFDPMIAAKYAEPLVQASVERLQAQLERAVGLTPKPKTVVVVTHVPPFYRASRYQGRLANAESRPLYSCFRLGKLLSGFAMDHADVRFEVFAGHTHTKADVRLAPNLRCRVFGARYRSPKVYALEV